MLKRNVIYLKNVIFIKLLTYISIIIVLLSIDDILINFLDELDKREKNRSYLLDQAKKKLSYIENLGEEITKFNIKYHELINKDNRNENCVHRNELVSKIKNLQIKYNLSKPIKVNVLKKLLKGANFKDTDNPFKVNTYELTINFCVPDIEKFFKISSDIYSILPNDSIIISCHVEQFKSFSPEMIKNLNPDRPLDLIYIKMTVYLNNIIYDIKF